jgi:hypothetical protein
LMYKWPIVYVSRRAILFSNISIIIKYSYLILQYFDCVLLRWQNYCRQFPP